MTRLRPRLRALLAAGVLAAAACTPGFQLKKYPTNETLYRASFEQYQSHNWDNAVAGFERLSTQLPAQDTLLPRVHYFLGTAHERQGEHLLAAQSFVHVVEGFPGDTLADDALYDAAHAYQEMWRKPELDAQYGEAALATYETLLSAYPTSPRVPDAHREIAKLRDWLGQKLYSTGDYYFRRRAYDSAIIYFQDVLDQYGDTPTAHRAGVKLLEVYQKLNYREEASELCRTLQSRYADDASIQGACRGVPAPTDSTPPAPAPSAVPIPGSAPAGQPPAGGGPPR